MNLAETANQQEIEDALAALKILKRKKPKEVKKYRSEKLVEMTSPIQLNTLINEPEKVQEIEVQIPQPEAIPEITVQKQELAVPGSAEPAVSIETETAEQKPDASFSSGCQYGFGYLRQREKGKGIPETCIECAKILECMLSEHYKEENSVKEIKKWYSF